MEVTSYLLFDRFATCERDPDRMLGGGFGAWAKLKSPLGSNSKTFSHYFY
jgi:hypothetical protein